MKYYPLTICLNMLVAFILISVHCDVPDSKLNFTELADKYGFRSQEYDVETEDGYFLKLFHIPGDRNRPILLMHGVLDSADTFIMRGRTSAVAALVGRGYDVWLGNDRGNRYSRRHTLLDIHDKSFWDFSFHEMAVFDLPAIIDFILSKNKVDKLSLIGHSQGNQIFFTLGAMRPEYNEKVNIAIALGPVAFVNVDNLEPPLSTLVRMGPIINELFKLTNQEVIFGDNSLLMNFRNNVCAQKLGYEICGAAIYSPLAGEDLAEFEPEIYYNVIGHYPCSTSRKNVEHVIQISLRNRFTQYDYGLAKNLKLYKSPSPPPYDLEKVTMRVAMLVGANDKIAQLRNAVLIRDRLPNVVSFRVMEYQKMNHIDFVWGRHMYQYLFPHIMKLLDDFAA